MNDNLTSTHGQSAIAPDATGVSEEPAVPISNKHVAAVLDGEENAAFASSYEHFSSFLSWTRTGG